MRLLVIFIITSISLVQATNSYAQKATVSLEVRNRTVKEVLDEIESQSEFTFFFNNRHLDLQRRVSVSEKKSDIFKVLDLIFAETNVRYSVLDKKIILTMDSDVPAKSQTVNRVTGKVVDVNGEPVIGANVFEKGTANGSITDINGNFTLSASRENPVLEISFIGYLSQTVKVKSGDPITITLSENNQLLDEVVVVGYGTQKKGNLTGAISTIKSNEITTTTHSSLAQNLQGKIPGLQIRQQSGAPGEFNTMINIRGFGEPLYVIDGIARDGSVEFQKLNPNDIENISILKDASAAIYGLNAANGVVLVTTKKGAQGKPMFSYNGVVGWQKPTDVPKMANASQILEMLNDANINSGVGPYISKEELLKWQAGGPGYESTDWYAETMKKNSFQQQHDFSVRGGSDAMNFFISFGYVDEQGLLKSNDLNYEKYTVRSNLTANLGKYLTADVMIAGRYDKKEAPGTDFFTIFKGTRAMLPTVRPFVNDDPRYPSKGQPYNEHPIVLSDRNLSGYTENVNKSFQSSASLTYDAPFLKGLKLKGTLAYDSNNSLQKELKKSHNLYSYSESDDTYHNIKIGNPSKISNTNSDDNRLLLQAQLSYNRKFLDIHNIGVTLVYEQNKSWYRYASLRREYEFYTNDQIDLAGLNNQQTEGHETESANISYVGRVNYDYKSKYLIEYAFRYDGSYRYAPENRWGFFPVVSAGWRLSEEDFIKDNLSFIDNLKIRGSYGLVGENAGDPFQYVLGFNASGGGGYEFVNGTYSNGIASPAVVNRNLTWFKSNIKDIGFESGILNGLLNIEFDIYQRDRKGLLSKRNLSLPNTFGGTLPDENLNSDRVRGFDFNISHKNKINDFTYGIAFNLNYARTKNIYVERGVYRSSWDKWKNGDTDRWKDVVWGFDQIDQFQNMEEVIHAPLQNGNLGNTKELPGDYIFRDVNGDGVIDDKDKLPLFYGGQPKLHYGITLSASWKGFDFSALLQGSGKYTVRFGEVYGNILCYRGNTPEYFYDRWHKADPYDSNSEWIPGKWPATRYGIHMGSIYKESRIWRRDASYLRLKSVDIGYTIPSNLVKKYWIDNARIYVTAHNLFTFADSFVKPFDPEKIEGAYSAGFTYPLTRSFNVGLNVTF